jgi:phosphatidylinositol phospholipase C delta
VKVRMSASLLSLLVYTVGVKCRGINKKESYAPEHMFSLSESTANKMFKRDGTLDLIKHNRSHLVRVYPKGTRVSSTNFLPQKYWSAGAQLVALNWQTNGEFGFGLLDKPFAHNRADLGYVINHAMFQRNGRCGYVLKPRALRTPDKRSLSMRTRHFLDVTVCDLPRFLHSPGP